MLQYYKHIIYKIKSKYHKKKETSYRNAVLAPGKQKSGIWIE